jgi:hypothetical protein
MGTIKLINMTPEQAYQILENSLNHATTRGAFTLQDTQAILQALSVVKPLTEKTNEIKDN